MDKIYKTYYKSEIGLIEISGTGRGILSLDFVEKKMAQHNDEVPVCIKKCLKQLDEYFKGERKDFDLQLITKGTDFQSKVWKQLLKIPYGKTLSYKDIAERCGNI